jgi:hypothetical protein
MTSQDLFAYPAGFHGGARVALGDVNGDGIPDIITGAGPGGTPMVAVFDGATGQLIRQFTAYTTAFTGGIFVAAADFNGDGRADIVTGADAGGGPEVRVFDGATGAIIRDFMAYDVHFGGGVRVAAGDVNGDGVPDIITGAGPGGGPQVKVIDGVTGGLLQTFMAYAVGFHGGVYVAAGDVNGDGHADIITGAGAGGGPQVKVISGANGSLLQTFMAYNPGFSGGVRVAAADIEGNGLADIITGPGPSGGPEARVFQGITNATLDDFFVLTAAFTGGVFVGGA